MRLLSVLHLPPFPQTISYRPWAVRSGQPSLLRWFAERLIARNNSDSLVVVCHHETDRSQAEEALEGLDVFVLVCRGDTLLSAVGEVGCVFPRLPIAYFHLEMMFAPSDLLERMAEHHVRDGNDFTTVADLPPLLCPEIAAPGLLSALAAIQFQSVPSPKEAVRMLGELRTNEAGSAPIRATPFRAGDAYSLPTIPSVSPLQTADDAQRAWQALDSLTAPHSFEALERWPSTRFDPLMDMREVRWQQDQRPGILYISPGSLYAGAEESLRTLVEGLAALGYQQTAVVTLEGVLSERLAQAGCQVICPNWFFSAPPVNGSQPDHAEQYAATLLDMVRPDFIHCNGDPGPAFLRKAQERRTPLVAHVRVVNFRGTAEWFSASSHLIAVSEFVKRRLVQSGVPAERISVIYNGIDTAAFSPGVFDKRDMRARFGLSPESFVILMVANFVPDKRHDLILEAFAHLQRRDATAQLVLAGLPLDRSVVERVHDRIAGLPQPAGVILLPFQRDVREVQCAADAAVLCSDNEALARCILEGMSLGMPVVASDNGGTCELFEHRKSGLAVTGGDARSLAAALKELQGSEQLRAALGAAARRRVEERYSVAEYARQVQRVLHQCAPATYWGETSPDRG